MRETGLGPLSSGARAIVIGGGPGGVAAAIALKQRAGELGREIQVTIIEGKQFSGEQHHNLCTGILSPPIITLIEHDLGVPFPYHLRRNMIAGYILHANGREITLDEQEDPSVSLRRVQFDDYMLKAAHERGVKILTARATGIEFHAGRVLVYTENQPEEGEVVIGAFGLDDGFASVFHHSSGYHPPPAMASIVTKYHPGPEGMHQFGEHIRAFLPAARGIEFGAVSPKGNHLTINIAGVAVNADLMDAFLQLPEVRRVLPNFENAGCFEANDLQYYKGHFPAGPGRKISGDRFVMVGDASGLVRAFKGKGVTAAIQTGIRAAETILRHGISAEAFQMYRAANQDIREDLPYGQAMRRVTILASRLGVMGAVIQAAGVKSELRQALFGAASGHLPYREVIRASISPASCAAIARAFLFPPPRQASLPASVYAAEKRRN